MRIFPFLPSFSKAFFYNPCLKTLCKHCQLLILISSIFLKIGMLCSVELLGCFYILDWYLSKMKKEAPWFISDINLISICDMYSYNKGQYILHQRYFFLVITISFLVKQLFKRSTRFLEVLFNCKITLKIQMN